MKYWALLCALYSTCLWADEVITLGAEDDWAPFSYVARNQAQGLAPKLVEAAFRTQGIKVKFRSVPFARCLRETQSGVLAGCFDIEKNSDNQSQYYFHTTPLLSEGLSIYALDGMVLRHLDLHDLAGHTVAITNGYTYPPAIMNNPVIKKDVSPSDEVQFKKLLAGRVQFALVNTTPAKLLLKKNPAFKAKIVEVGLVNTAQFYLGFSKRHPAGEQLAQRFEQGLRAIHSSGEYDKLQQEFKASLQ